MLDLYVASHSLVVLLVQASFAGEPVQMEVVDLDEVLTFFWLSTSLHTYPPENSFYLHKSSSKHACVVSLSAFPSLFLSLCLLFRSLPA
jgi:hypothetical protein